LMMKTTRIERRYTLNSFARIIAVSACSSLELPLSQNGTYVPHNYTLAAPNTASSLVKYTFQLAVFPSEESFGG
ncbi:MAG TPA: hypothetical protein VFP11_16585, partial [Candidatus Angelobacter sp.]|nr:hypothetical protein [Candidatus Angelobacter sp.]